MHLTLPIRAVTPIESGVLTPRSLLQAQRLPLHAALPCGEPFQSADREPWPEGGPDRPDASLH